MNKVLKAHHLWSNQKTSDLQPLTRSQAIDILSKVCELTPFSGGEMDRVDVLQTSGAIIRGYVTYLSDLGGFIVYANHNVREMNKSNVIPLSIDNIVSVQQTRNKIFIIP